MSSNLNSISERHSVSAVKLQVPIPFNRFLKMPRRILLGGLTKQIENECKALPILLKELKLDSSLSNNYKKLRLASHAWVEQMTSVLRSSFMEFLVVKKPIIDEYLINDANNTILQCRALIIHLVRNQLYTNCPMLSFIQRDKLMRFIQKKIDNWREMWSDDFEAWFESRRLGSSRSALPTRTIKSIEGDSQAPYADESTTTRFVPKSVDKGILEVLSKSRQCLLITEIGTRMPKDLPNSRNTIGPRLKKLTSHGYVEKPGSDSGGFVITPAGSGLLESISNNT